MGTLRFLLAASVILHHSTPIFGFMILDADTAVKAFFVISGFYMSMVWNEKYRFQPSPKATFWTNRALRLYPTYFLAVGLQLLSSWGYYGITHWKIGALWLHWDYASAMHWASTAWFLLTSVLILGQDWNSFLVYDPRLSSLTYSPMVQPGQIPAGNFDFVPQAWSLGSELTFYLLVPFLVGLRWRQFRWFLLFAVGGKLASEYLFHSLQSAGNPQFQINRFFPAIVYLFLMGSVSYRIYVRLAGYADRAWFSKVRGMIAMLLLAGTVLVDTSHKVTAELFFGIVIVGIPFLFHLTRRWRVDQLIGELSYPMYILHFAFAPFITSLAKRMNPGSNGLILLVVTVGVSIAVHYWLERPIERMRQKRVSIE